MFIQSITKTARHAACRIKGDERGNVAMIFAVALVPLLGFVGAGVDYSRTNAARSSMQVALDSAALMVSKDLGNDPKMPLATVKSKAVTYFNALYTNNVSSPITVDASYTSNTKDGSTVTVTGSGTVATDFMKMVGFPQMTIRGTSTTTWGSTRMRVAIALDVTGSMNSDGKLAAMKTAAQDLITTLKTASRMKEDVYVSIVPFAQMINVGTDSKDASWLRWDQLGTCSDNLYVSRETCRANGKTWTTSTNKNSWKGCVMERDEPYDTRNDPPSGTSTNHPAMLYRQQNEERCPPQLLPMTSVYEKADDIKTMIGNLTAVGGTNQLIGLFWAWQTLQTSDPFPTPAKDENYNYTDAIILLSDGENTGSRQYGKGTVYTPAIDTRQQMLCDNIKKTETGKPGAIVYTIQVNTDGDAESAILKYCASPNSFYPATTGTGIANAFTAIGNALNALRVSK